ncbi:hypothetical protein CD178_01646 [Komagataeibacter saccharivorans]|uniref:Uncharacterized protein n=2 Tax=Komagataeibacter saccharivorans TaxID=265959 RepID=A0A347WC20_9PROT|nr:hypothetical protein CD178_01646 [Komagataeibacter saccharivorans]
MHRLTLAGTGIAQLSMFQVQEDFAVEKLVHVLERLEVAPFVRTDLRVE